MANTPEIRFRGFREPWEQRKFGDLADYKKGPFGSSITKNMFVPKSDNSVKVYEQQNAINKDWSLERYFLPKDYVLNKLKSFEVHGGDIIVSCAGTIGEIYEIPKNAEDGVINQALMRVRVNKDIVDKKMFIISFANMIDDFTRAHSNGSAIKNIPPFADLKPMHVLIPSIEEQKRISGFFDNLDNLITLHQRKYDEIKEVKKYMLQKMFPKNGEKVPEIRFSGFTASWEQRKLEDYIIEYHEVTTENNQYPALTSSRKGIFLQTEYFSGNQIASDDNTGYNIVPYGYFTYRHMSDDEIFHFNINDIVENGIVSTLYPVFTTNDKLDSRYLQYQLNYGYEFARFAVLQKQGGSRTYMYLSKLKQLSLTMPKDIEEQKMISGFFMELDNLITLHQHKCDELKEVKKFMLQNMFPRRG